MPNSIDIADIIPMDIFCGSEPVVIDLVYADSEHPENIFGIALYHKNACLSLHRDLACIVLKAARTLHTNHGWKLVLKDGLRTIEAQEAMAQTDIVKANPHWMQDPGRLLSGPGQGAHPRGMAIDVSVIDQKGNTVDMGTVFDAMVLKSARDYSGFSHLILENRKILEDAFTGAAQSLSLPMLPLPSEWWDFRFPAAYYGSYAPLSDNDLPEALKMCAPSSTVRSHDFTDLAKSVLMSL